MDGAVEIACLGQVLGGPEQHGGVAVMAAAMHLAWNLGRMRKVVLFPHVQRVHVGAERYRFIDAGSTAALQCADDTGTAEAAMHLNPPFLQLRRDDAGCPELLERRFGVGMEVAPPSGHLLVEVGDSVDDRHVSSLVSCRLHRGHSWAIPMTR